MTLDEAPTALDDHRPAAKLVYLVLDQQGPLTGRELQESTRLPGSTARREAGLLMDDGLVETGPGLGGDARVLTYDLVRHSEDSVKEREVADRYPAEAGD